MRWEVGGLQDVDGPVIDKEASNELAAHTFEVNGGIEWGFEGVKCEECSLEEPLIILKLPNFDLAPPEKGDNGVPFDLLLTFRIGEVGVLDRNLE